MRSSARQRQRQPQPNSPKPQPGVGAGVPAPRGLASIFGNNLGERSCAPAGRALACVGAPRFIPRPAPAPPRTHALGTTPALAKADAWAFAAVRASALGERLPYERVSPRSARLADVNVIPWSNFGAGGQHSGALGVSGPGAWAFAGAGCSFGREACKRPAVLWKQFIWDQWALRLLPLAELTPTLGGAGRPLHEDGAPTLGGADRFVSSEGPRVRWCQ